MSPTPAQPTDDTAVFWYELVQILLSISISVLLILTPVVSVLAHLFLGYPLHLHWVLLPWLGLAGILGIALLLDSLSTSEQA